MQGPVRILWRSRHGPQKKHLDLLRKIYGNREVKIDEDRHWILDSKDVAEQFRKGKYDDLFVGAPLAIIKVLVEEEGLNPLISDNEKSSPGDADFHDSHAFWKIIGLRRVNNIVISTTLPEPFAATRH